MRIRRFIVLFLLLSVSQNVSARQTVGYVENVTIYPGSLHMHAKIDSGATNSSLTCQCSEIIKKDGAEWVRFTMTDMKGRAYTFEKKVVRYANVIRHFNDVQRRPVIRLGICIATIYREVEVNLVNRTGYKYQMLIGRSFMRHDFLVAPDNKFLTKPDCTVQND